MGTGPREQGQTEDSGETWFRCHTILTNNTTEWLPNGGVEATQIDGSRSERNLPIYWRFQRTLAGARDEPKTQGHECDGLLDRSRRVACGGVGAFHEERKLSGRGLQLHLAGAIGMREKPQPVIVGASVRDEKLLAPDTRMRALEFIDHSINIATRLHPANAH